MNSQVQLPLQKDNGIVIVGGSGNIGRRIISRIGTKNKIISILGSNDAILKEGGIDKKLLEQISNSGNKDIARDLVSENGESQSNIVEIVSYLKSEGIIPVIIDASNGDIDHHSIRGEIISTANKVPLSTSSVDHFKGIVGPNYGSETTVMAGQGPVGRIERELNLGNQITKIEGVFSGTLGFIMSALKDGKSFSSAINIAIKEGYTEPNPMDDLDGLDVAKKLVILARYAGYDVSLDDIEVTGLLDDSYRGFFKNGIDNKSKQEFINEIKEKEDKHISMLLHKASMNMQTLSYVATLDNTGEELVLKVGLEFKDIGSDIGGLTGTGNIAVIKNNQLDSNSQPPIVIKGPGAGINTTANGVLMNLHDILLRK